MVNELIELSWVTKSKLMHAFEEALVDRELYYKATSLNRMGFHRGKDLYTAVQRAMKICVGSGVPVREHFRTIYVVDCKTHTIVRDWKLSKLAFALILINGAPDNPLVGKMQMKLIRNFLGQ